MLGCAVRGTCPISVISIGDSASPSSLALRELNERGPRSGCFCWVQRNAVPRLIPVRDPRPFDAPPGLGRQAFGGLAHYQVRTPMPIQKRRAALASRIPMHERATGVARCP